MDYFKRWFSEKLVYPMRSLPRGAVVAATGCGAWLGLFPIPGASTVMLLFSLQILNIVGKPFKASQTTIALAINLLITPISVLLIPMWLRFGSSLCSLQNCSASDILPAFKVSFFNACYQFAACLLAAMAAWLLVSPLFLAPFYALQKSYVEESKKIRQDSIPLMAPLSPMNSNNSIPRQY